MALARGQWQNRKARKCSGGAPGTSAAYGSPVREGRFEVRARGGDRERGASLVEFALVVPLLTLFLFGIVQFGLAYDKKQSINSAAREGARTAAIPTNTVSTAKAAAEDSFDGLLDGTVTTSVYVVATTSTPMSGAPLGDAVKPCQGNEGKLVIVISRVEHVLTIPFFGAPVLNLEGRGEFRCERQG